MATYQAPAKSPSNPRMPCSKKICTRICDREIPSGMESCVSNCLLIAVDVTGEQQSKKEGDNEFEITLPQKKDDWFLNQLAIGCERLCREKSFDDEKRLNGDARVLRQPGKQFSVQTIFA